MDVGVHLRTCNSFESVYLASFDYVLSWVIIYFGKWHTYYFPVSTKYGTTMYVNVHVTVLRRALSWDAVFKAMDMSVYGAANRTHQRLHRH